MTSYTGPMSSIGSTEPAITRRATEVDRERWDRFVAACPNAHIFQSWTWIQSRTTSPWPDRWIPFRFWVERGGEPVISIAILYRKLPLLGGILWAPRGPSLRVIDQPAVAELVAALRRLATKTGAIVLLANPALPPESPEIAALEQAGLERLSLRLPVVNMPTPVMRVSLVAEPNALLAAMDKQARNMIRRAEREGVQVRQSRDIHELREFYEMYRALGRKKNFPVRPWQDLLNLWRWMEPEDGIQLFRAEREGKFLAGAITLTLGRSCWWLYGGSGEHSNKHLYPAHLLQWKIMQWARERKCEIYDMRGAMGYNHSSDSPAYGVYHFKKSLGAVLTHFAGEYGLVFRPRLYWLLSKAAPRFKSMVRRVYVRNGRY